MGLLGAVEEGAGQEAELTEISGNKTTLPH